jgi:hypothetical protein
MECEVDELKTSPLMVELRKGRDALLVEVKRLYRTIKKINEANSIEYQLYK